MQRIIEVKSARDGMTIELSNFVPENGSPISETFMVTISNYEIRAEARASSFMAPDLAEYFSDIAKSWKGWKGEKKWSTLEGEFELIATADHIGHIRLAYFLRPPYTGFHWEVRGALELEAGQLEGLAEQVRMAWQTE